MPRRNMTEILDPTRHKIIQYPTDQVLQSNLSDLFVGDSVFRAAAMSQSQRNVIIQYRGR